MSDNTLSKADTRVISAFVEDAFPFAEGKDKKGLVDNILAVINREEYCPCGNPVTGDYGICNSPNCK